MAVFLCEQNKVPTVDELAYDEIFNGVRSHSKCLAAVKYGVFFAGWSFDGRIILEWPFVKLDRALHKK